MASRFILPTESEVQTTVTVDGNTTFFQDTQECSDIIARCAAERATEDRFRGNRKSAPFRCVMEIPTVMVTALKAQGVDILGDKAALRKVVNDPTFAAFRTSTGRL